MSSSNEVQISYIEETVYGETPGAGNFKQARFTSDGLNASVETTESAQIRTDRLSSGQVATGSTISGELPIEFSKSQDIDDFIEGAMMNSWVNVAVEVIGLTVDVTAKTIIRSAGDWTVLSKVGDVIQLSDMDDVENNEVVMITEIVDTTTIKFAGPKTMITGTGAGASLQRGDQVDIGTTKRSFAFEKKFNDLADKGIIYNGMYTDGFNIAVSYGDIVTGAFNFVGSDSKAVDQAADLITNLRTVDAAPTGTSFNGSIDMAFLATSAGSTFSGVDFCIQSIDITLANNAQAQNCLGKLGPDQYSLGQADVSISLSVYLSDQAWGFLNKRLTQESFSLGFILKNAGGWYAFFVPALQISMDDPSSGGQNTDIIIDMSGVGKVGANNEKSLYVYKSL